MQQITQLFNRAFAWAEQAYHTPPEETRPWVGRCPECGEAVREGDVCIQVGYDLYHEDCLLDKRMTAGN